MASIYIDTVKTVTASNYVVSLLFFTLAVVSARIHTVCTSGFFRYHTSMHIRKVQNQHLSVFGTVQNVQLVNLKLITLRAKNASQIPQHKLGVGFQPCPFIFHHLNRLPSQANLSRLTAGTDHCL